MKTEDLKNQGLTDEQISFVMSENGKDIEKFKTENETNKTELKSVKEQLKSANETIESYKNMNIEDIKKSADDYKAKFEQSENERKSEIEKLKLTHAIDNALTKAGAKNLNAVKATLDLSNVKLDGDKLLGFDDLLKNSKEQDGYLYDDVQQSQGTGSTGNFGKQNNQSSIESVGQRLGKQETNANSIDNPYFK
jgi:phage minor structural protein GP20|uniref:Minor structural protein n=1 Tax=Myoviridae sp. ctfyA6 TaxID=2827698 RepID=A0A8S5SSM4_9CAUD|nr:MAG TPA: minor structural protein [Caudoviricetes sp.]DAF54036.1 MAG TPA: minor structural protein [Myoviridae sp. ctfyA6]